MEPETIQSKELLCHYYVIKRSVPLTPSLPESWARHLLQQHYALELNRALRGDFKITMIELHGVAKATFADVETGLLPR